VRAAPLCTFLRMRATHLRAHVQSGAPHDSRAATHWHVGAERHHAHQVCRWVERMLDICVHVHWFGLGPLP
jgi:hypothetical protein